MRRELYRPVPPDTLLDDVVVPMTVVAQGFRCVLAPDALLYDDASETPAAEGVRKRRTLTGCVQLAQRHPRWMVPGLCPIGWQFFSHKIARLGSPLLLMGLLSGSIFLWETVWIRMLLWAQILVYGVVGLAWIPVARGRRIPWVGPAVMFVSLNLATLAALWNGARGRYQVAWK
jgi:hypothetical protein